MSKKKTSRKSPGKNSIKSSNHPKRRRAFAETHANEFLGIIFIALAAFCVIAFFTDATGKVGAFFSDAFMGLFGALGYIFPAVVFIAGIVLIAKPEWFKIGKVISALVLILSLSSFLHLFEIKNIGLSAGYFKFLGESFKMGMVSRMGGGLFGGLLTYPLWINMDAVGSYITVCVLVLSMIMVLTKLSIKKVGKDIADMSANAVTKIKSSIDERKNSSQGYLDIEEEKPKQQPIKEDKQGDPWHAPIYTGSFKKPDTKDKKKEYFFSVDDEKPGRLFNDGIKPEDDVMSASAPVQSDIEEKGIERIKKRRRAYSAPPITLLNDSSPGKGTKSSEDIRKNARILEETLKNFGIIATVVNITRGPVITRYELQPAPGMKVSRIVSLSDDIALSLAAPRVRIEAPIPGKAAVGIEVPNMQTDFVYIKDLLSTKEFKDASSPLFTALGRDLAGKAVYTDIAQAPHLLIAGATGSGKSVCVNTLITSILYKATPEQVKFIMIDPKMVELSAYNGIPHLSVPVVTDSKKAAGALHWVVAEMTERYKKFNDRGAKDLLKYNELVRGQENVEPLPYVVVIIDELADLMSVSKHEVEDAICRIAQLGRACGIHLVIATQRPSVDVITGVIKANVPSRIAFSVSSQVDSRTILDMAGAEKLMGKGDMLFHPIGMAKPMRLQGAFIRDNEVEAVIDYLKQNGETAYDADIEDAMKSSSGTGKVSSGEEVDEMFEQAVEIGIDAGEISTSMLQRRLRIGYARAGRLIDEMETRSLIGPYNGAKPRKMLITREQFNQLFERG